MQLRFYKNVSPACDSLAAVTSLSWAANNGRFAAVIDRVVFLYDDTGERKDKFKTKPADAATQPNYIVREMAWSPDSSKLAIAQSDNIVFVYRRVTPQLCRAVSFSCRPRGVSRNMI